MAKIFIMGGAYQGKCRYAKENYNISPDKILDFDAFAASKFRNESIDLLEEILKFADSNMVRNAYCFYNCHRFVECAVKAHTDALDLWKRLLFAFAASDNWCVIMDEIGNGIVPIDQFEREYREQVGIFGCYIADKADEAVRVICGIGNRIK